MGEFLAIRNLIVDLEDEEIHNHSGCGGASRPWRAGQRWPPKGKMRGWRWRLTMGLVCIGTNEMAMLQSICILTNSWCGSASSLTAAGARVVSVLLAARRGSGPYMGVVNANYAAALCPTTEYWSIDQSTAQVLAPVF